MTRQWYYDLFLVLVWFVIVTEKIWLCWCCPAVPAQLVSGDGAWARCWALRAGSTSNTASQEEVFGDFLFSSQGGPLWVLANHSYSATYQLSQLWVDLKEKQQKAKKTWWLCYSKSSILPNGNTLSSRKRSTDIFSIHNGLACSLKYIYKIFMCVYIYIYSFFLSSFLLSLFFSVSYRCPYC